MKYLSLLLVLLLTVGCTSSTEFGKCVGVNDRKDSTLEYKYNTKNIILSLLFLETLVVPLVVVFDEIQCPQGKN